MNQNKWKKKFFTIAIGQAISLIGSSAVQFALIWWLAEKTASPMMMGISGIVAFLPMTLFSPLAGVFADKYNRKIICIVADMSLGILALIYAVLLYFIDLPVWTVLVVLCLRGLGGTFHQPSMQSIIPQLVPAEYLMKANGWIQLMTSGSFILGPVIGAALYAAMPLWVVLLTDTAGAIFASVTLAVVFIPKLEAHELADESMFRQFKDGIKVYLEDQRLFYIMIAEALCMLFYAPLSTFYPLLTSDYFDLSALHGSIVEMAFAVGMMIIALLFGSVLKVERKIRMAYIGLIGVGFSTMLCGLLPPTFTGWMAFVVFAAFMGGSGNIHSIPLVSYMQETIPPEKMGRAFSVMTLISSLTMPLGLLFSSPFAEQLGVHSWFFISGIGILLLTFAIILISKSRAKAKS